MESRLVSIRAFADQKPGTSGLRKPVSRFRETHYLESFIQSIFDAVPAFSEGKLLLGGDGRYFNREAMQTIIRIAVANRVPHLQIALHGLLSTPACSERIRAGKLSGGILLTASHNPGGPHGDFGVKFNVASGSPASESVTEAVFQRSRRLDTYRIAQVPHVDIDHVGSVTHDQTTIDVIEVVEPYADALEAIFDFDRIRALIAQPEFEMRFDAMHAVTGPYARAILQDRLGLPEEHILRGEPLADFGGRHPDPSLAHAPDLERLLMTRKPIDFGAASDGDGDRNLIVGPNCFVSPGDSLAILAAHAHRIPYFRDGLSGIARSMPTSRAADAVAASLGIECHETPTGWKFFGNLLDAGRIRLCGEESFGTGSDHVREKDGLWAVLFWLNLLAVTGKTVPQLVHEHWAHFGRHATERLDFEDLNIPGAEALIDHLRTRLPRLVGTRIANTECTLADEFRYVDPIDGSVAEHQGLRIVLGDAARIVVRLSGTGTHGATLRVYLERLTTEDAVQKLPAALLLKPLRKAALQLLEIEHFTGAAEPTAVV